MWRGESRVNGGRGRPVFGLPAPLARIQARLMELAPGEPVMSRDNLDAMKIDNVASGQLPGLDALEITPTALRAQHDLQVRLVDAIALSYEARERAGMLRTSLRGLPTGADLADVASRATLLIAQLDTVYGLDGGGRGRGGAAAPNFSGLNGTFVGQLNAQDLGDMAPTTAARAAFAKSCLDLKSVLTSLERISTKDLTAFNTVLTGRGKTAVVIDGKPFRIPRC